MVRELVESAASARRQGRAIILIAARNEESRDAALMLAVYLGVPGR